MTKGEKYNLYMFTFVGTYNPYSLNSLRWEPYTHNSTQRKELENLDFYLALVRVMFPKFKVEAGFHASELIKRARFYLTEEAQLEFIKLIHEKANKSQLPTSTGNLENISQKENSIESYCID